MPKPKTDRTPSHIPKFDRTLSPKLFLITGQLISAKFSDSELQLPSRCHRQLNPKVLYPKSLD